MAVAVASTICAAVAVAASLAPSTRPTGASIAATRPAATRPSINGAGPSGSATTRAVGTRPQSRPAPARATASRPRPAVPALEEVHFATTDNLTIAADFARPARAGERAPMAILLHMYNSDRTAYGPLIPALQQSGLAVLAIDLRGHGRSVGPPGLRLAERVAQRDRKLFEEMDRDVEAAYAWLSRQPDVDPARFALVGASVGCSVAFDYAARDRSVDALVCLTPGTAYLGLDALADARKYGRRALLMIASEEERGACDDLRRMVPDAVARIVGRAGSDRLGLHGTRVFGRVAGIEKDIAAFLIDAVGAPTEDPVIASVQSDVYHHADAGSARQISPENIRWFSSPEEAEARGLRPPKTRSTRRGRVDDEDPDGEPFPSGEGPASR